MISFKIKIISLGHVYLTFFYLSQKIRYVWFLGLKLVFWAV